MANKYVIYRYRCMANAFFAIDVPIGTNQWKSDATTTQFIQIKGNLCEIKLHYC